MQQSYPVGQAPWETQGNQGSQTPKSFPVGQAPWEQTQTANTSGGATQQPESLLGKAGDAVKGIANWAFPIVGDIGGDINGTNNKSALQQAGDAGLSAMWFIPGLGEAGEAAKGVDAAVEGGEALAKGTDVASKIYDAGSNLASKVTKKLPANLVKGSAYGYGQGVASNLSQGQSIGQAITPGLSNIAGAVTGGLGATLLPKLFGKLSDNLSQSGALSSIEDNVRESLNATKTGRKWMSQIGAGDPSKLIAQSGAASDIDVEGQKLSTGEAQKTIQSRIAQLGQARGEALDKIGKTMDTEGLRNEALSQVKSLAASGQTSKISKQINDMFNDFKSTYGKSLTPSQLEDIKETQAGNSNIYKNNGLIGEQNASSIIGNVARSKIEQLADQSGFSGMKEYNSLIKEHYNALTALQKLDGQAVKGGLLGNTIRKSTLGAVGGVSGAVLGGGVLGSVGGLLAGEGAGAALSKILGDTSISNPLKEAVLSRLEKSDPDIVKKLASYTGRQESVAPVMRAKPKGKISGIVPGVVGGSASNLGARGGQYLNSFLQH